MVKFKTKHFRRCRCCCRRFRIVNKTRSPSRRRHVFPPTLTCWRLSISVILLIIEFLPPLMNGVSAAALAEDSGLSKNRTFTYNNNNNNNINNSIIITNKYEHLLLLSNVTTNDKSTDNIVDKNHDVVHDAVVVTKVVKMDKQKRQQMSQRLFESLIGKEFEDEPLDPPEWSKLSKQARRELRRQSRRQRNKTLRNLPGGRRALTIATRDAVKPGHCRIMPMKQRVRMDGCATKVIVNSFCYGQCNSFFIPKLSKKHLKTAFESCSVCQPTQFEPLTVTLNCPHRQPPYVVQQVMTIKQCTCKSVCSITNDFSKKLV